MDPDNKDAPEVLETPEGNETEGEQVEKVELTKAEADELRRKAEERDELEKKNKQLFERAKQSEAKAKEAQGSLSAEDIVALRDVHEDDIPTLQKWAKNEGISLAEARKDKDLQIILNARAEERRTAAATQTTGGSRGAKKPSGEDLLDKAIRTNELPDDDEGMAAIAAARQHKKK